MQQTLGSGGLSLVFEVSSDAEYIQLTTRRHAWATTEAMLTSELSVELDFGCRRRTLDGFFVLIHRRQFLT